MTTQVPQRPVVVAPLSFRLITHRQCKCDWCNSLCFEPNQVRELKIMLCVCNVLFLYVCNFSFQQYISQVCKSYFYHISDFRRIRRHLSLSSAKTILVVLIKSRLDYCHSFLNNCQNNLSKFQHVHNCLARLALEFLTITT